MVERFNANPAAQAWEREFSDIVEYIDVDPRTGWPMCLPEVWNLAPQPKYDHNSWLPDGWHDFSTSMA